MTAWQSVVIEPVKNMLSRAGEFIPTLVGVLLIFVVGWIIAKAIQGIVTKILKAVKLDNIAEKAGIQNFLLKGDIRYSLAELVGVLVYWLAMLIVFVAALNAFNLTIAAQLLDKVVLYVPNVIAAIFILVIGMFLATLVGTVVKTAAANTGISQSKLLSQIVQVVIVVFAIAIALEQLQIGTAIVALSFNIILASVGIAISLAFGLGCKDIAGRAVQDFLDKLKKK